MNQIRNIWSLLYKEEVRRQNSECLQPFVKHGGGSGLWVAFQATSTLICTSLETVFSSKNAGTYYFFNRFQEVADPH